MPTTRRQARRRRLKALGKRPSTPAITDGGVLAAIKIAVYVLGRDAKDVESSTVCMCSARCQARRWSVLAANHNCVHVHRGDGNDGGIEHCVYVLGKMPSTAIVASSPPIIIAVCSHEIYCVCARRSENCVL